MKFLLAIAGFMLAVQLFWRVEPQSDGWYRKRGFLFALAAVLAMFIAMVWFRSLDRLDLAESVFLLGLFLGMACLYLAAVFPPWVYECVRSSRFGRFIGQTGLRGALLTAGLFCVILAQGRYTEVNAATQQCAHWYLDAGTSVEREAVMTRVPDPELRPLSRHGSKPPYRCSGLFRPV